jgi:predicted anti-sigma-YlaC factor YlaD
MRCDACRDAISARLDGFDGGELDAAAVDAHLATCPGCRSWSAEAERLHRFVRLRPAEPVPDLTGAILAAAPGAPAPRRTEWARYVLLVVALTRLVLALRVIVFGEITGVGLHMARELGSWDLALAVGLLVVAWRPGLARGMLAFALTLALALTVTTTLDVVTGRIPFAGESTHAFELVGVAMVWLLARSSGPAPAGAVRPRMA